MHSNPPTRRRFLNKLIWQTGSWQRSQATFRWAAELVQNGHLGKVTRVEVGLPAGHTDFGGTGNDKPDGLDPSAQGQARPRRTHPRYKPVS